MSDSTTDRVEWIKSRIGDELGFSEEDLAALYKMSPADLNKQIGQFDQDVEILVAQILADVNAAINANRQAVVTETHIAAIKALIARYPIRKLVPLKAIQGPAWRLTADDAQWVAYRLADVINLDFASSDTLRRRLNRIALSYGADQPPWDDALRSQILNTSLYLCQLAGVL